MEGLRSSMSWSGGAEVTYWANPFKCLYTTQEVNLRVPWSTTHSRGGGGAGCLPPPNSIPSRVSDVSTSRTLDLRSQSLVNRRCDCQKTIPDRVDSSPVKACQDLSMLVTR